MNDTEVDKVYLDLETNGLNNLVEKNGVMVSGASIYGIIEIGIILTDKDENVIDIFESSVKINPSDIANANEFCRNLHTETGTYDKCLSSPNKLSQVETEVIAFLEKNNAKEKLLIAGQSIHFDKEFIKYQMPNLSKMFNHQAYDISTLLKLNKDKYPDVLGELTAIKKDLYNHTALDDISFSLISGKTYDEIAKGSYLPNQEKITDAVKKMVHSNKDSVLDSIAEYRFNKDDQDYKDNINLDNISISNFKRKNTVVSVLNQDPDDWSDDTASALDISYDIILDPETTASIKCITTDFKTLMESPDVSVEFKKHSENDPLKSYIEGEGLDSKFISDSRKSEILELTRHIHNRMSLKSEAVIETRSLPSIFKAYTSGNAMQNRCHIEHQADNTAKNFIKSRKSPKIIPRNN